MKRRPHRPQSPHSLPDPDDARGSGERFYAPQLSADSPVKLTGTEAHHLVNVLRMRTGQSVTLFDGQGRSGRAEIVSLSKRQVELRVGEIQTEPAPLVPLVLATAAPKGDRFRWLVEKATELGVDRLVPLQTDRSVVDPRAGKLEKMRQTVIAAAKQSGRNRLMELAPPTAWTDFVSREFSTAAVYVAHPSGGRLPPLPMETNPSGDPPSPPTALVLAVGPEGGFTEEEVEQAAVAGARLVSLGPAILRIETAALALAAWFTLGRTRP